MSASFEYDALGRRRSRTVGSTSTQYLFDGLNPVQELVSGTSVASLLTGGGVDEYFTRSDAGGTSNYLTDAIGSTVALANTVGTVQTEYTYEPFGLVTTSGTATGNTYAFTGREADGTGLYFHRARFFNPRLGRFISEDPIAFAAGDVNLFAYSANDPVSKTDRLGLDWSSNWAFFWQFAFGSGDRKRNYGAGDKETAEVANSPGIDSLRRRFEAEGCKTIENGEYGTFEAFWDTVLNPRTNDWSSTATQVGGFARAKVVNNGNGTATFIVRNIAGANSFFYHVLPNRRAEEGAFTNIQQVFTWTEAIPCTAGRK